MPGVGRMPKSITSAPLASNLQSGRPVKRTRRACIPSNHKKPERSVCSRPKRARLRRPASAQSLGHWLFACQSADAVCSKYLGLAIGSIPIENDFTRMSNPRRPVNGPSCGGPRSLSTTRQ
jgi:hypothetical protein